MRMKNRIKKGIAALLSGALLVGMTAGIMPGNTSYVQAEGEDSGKPSVAYYATKEQLMDGTFAPDADGKAKNIGKLKLGNRKEGTSWLTQTWYVLGSDSGVQGDNTVIFAANPMVTGSRFNSDRQDRAYKAADGTYTGGNPATVSASHYGASGLRANLQEMAEPSYNSEVKAYFNKEQKKLLQKTTVTTRDIKNNKDYTTSDDLYALKGKSGEKTICAGSNDDKVLAGDPYWKYDFSSDYFWLRSAYSSNDARPAVNVAMMKSLQVGYSQNVDSLYSSGCAIRPASNLNLSNVLFAAAAPAGLDYCAPLDLKRYDAMTLRLDGKAAHMDIGTVEYNPSKGLIKAVKGTIGNPYGGGYGDLFGDSYDDSYYHVNVVVQGGDSANPWSYSEYVETTEYIDTAEIKSALAKQGVDTGDIDLKECHIWLETTGWFYRMTYAVEATETEDDLDSEIKWVDVDSVGAPTAGEPLDTSAICVTTGISTVEPAVTWTPDDTTANYGTSYTASVTLAAKNHYKFADSVKVWVNDEKAKVKKNEDGTLKVTYTFPKTDSQTPEEPITDPKIDTQPQGVSVKTGEQATFTVVASGTDLTYQWQIDRKDGKGFVDIEGANRADYTTGKVDKDCDGFQYRCKISNSRGSVTTQAATLKVTKTIYTIEAKAGANGSISPSGSVEITEGESQTFTITANEGYEIESLKVDGSEVNITSSYTFENVATSHTIEVTFGTKANDKLISITAPKPVTVANGTTYADMKLPTHVNIVTQHGTADRAVVSWDTSSPVSGSYDPAVLTEQTVTLKGTVTCPDDLDVNGVELTTSITVTISAAGITGAPIASVESGTYTEDQTIILSSTTEGAKIYYTTDGSTPTLENGMPTGTTVEYTAPISVNGTEGQSVVTTIIAIAVKDDMQDSEEKTFTYTIAKPMNPPTVEAPVISTQPQNVSVKAGEQATFTVAATGTDLIYRWQVDRNDGKGFVDIDGANSASYTTGVTDKECNGFKYQCIISNTAGSVTTGTATLTITENATPQPDQYKIIEGANSTWTQNTDGSLAIRGDGEMAKFQSVKVDGAVIDPKNYTVTEGSTIITLKAEYLKTLSVGSHTFEIVWTDGSAGTSLTIAQNTPGTNDTGNKENTNNVNTNNTNTSETNKNTDLAQTTESKKKTTDTKKKAADTKKTDTKKVTDTKKTTDTKKVTESKQKTDTKKSSQNATPSTGDTMNLALLVTLLIVSLAGLIGILGRWKHNFK